MKIISFIIVLTLSLSSPVLAWIAWPAATPDLFLPLDPTSAQPLFAEVLASEPYNSTDYTRFEAILEHSSSKDGTGPISPPSHAPSRLISLLLHSCQLISVSTGLCYKAFYLAGWPGSQRTLYDRFCMSFTVPSSGPRGAFSCARTDTCATSSDCFPGVATTLNYGSLNCSWSDIRSQPLLPSHEALPLLTSRSSASP